MATGRRTSLKEIRGKIKSVFSGIGQTTPGQEASSISSMLPENASWPEPAAFRLASYAKSSGGPNPQADQEVMESIEKEYFSDEHFDTSLFELQKLPEPIEPALLESDLKRLKRQLQVVSRKVSQLILENRQSYSHELDRVIDLQNTLQLATVHCYTIRRHLIRAQSGFTGRSLALFCNYQRKQKLLVLLDLLKTIKTLQRSDVRLREILAREEFAEAIELCLECQRAANLYKHYSCISELSTKLQDTLESIEDSLSAALAKQCSAFDEAQYARLQLAYRLLGKTHAAIDQMLMHYFSVVHQVAFAKVLGYVELANPGKESSAQKRQFNELCKLVPVDLLIPCLRDVCKALWEVVKSYLLMARWHAGQPQPEPASETAFSRMYVQQKVEQGRARLWQEIHQKVRILVAAAEDLAAFQFEDFLRLLNCANRFTCVGEEFSGSLCEGLQDTLRSHSLRYLDAYHRQRVDELRMFLENEGWQLCPVRADFSLVQLQELAPLKECIAAPGRLSLDKGKGGLSLQTYLDDERCPFDLDEVLFEEEPLQADVAEDADEPDSSDSEDGSPSSPGRARSPGQQGVAPIVTNTTLTVLRLLGRYLQMVLALRPIAFEVIQHMSQFFDFYLLAVQRFFAPGAEQTSERLRTSLRRIADALGDRLPTPSPALDLRSRDNLFGLSERVVAVESLVFLAEQLALLQPALEALTPQAKRAFLQQFFAQTVHPSSELRAPVYAAVAQRALNLAPTFNLMGNVRWDLSEIASQHSAYVDALCKELEIVDVRLGELAHRVPMPHDARRSFWTQCVRLAHHTLVEGFATAKKCSNEGRALMQLDVQHYLRRVEAITQLRPVPHKDAVETYVKAFYLPENALEPWIKEHRKDYSDRALAALVASMGQISKRAKARLIAMIDGADVLPGKK